MKSKLVVCLFRVCSGHICYFLLVFMKVIRVIAHQECLKSSTCDISLVRKMDTWMLMLEKIVPAKGSGSNTFNIGKQRVHLHTHRSSQYSSGKNALDD